ncbi:MAG: metalloregulator ArsR/SmtB family transcription factor [Gammaproteobacteria bacterium]
MTTRKDNEAPYYFLNKANTVEKELHFYPSIYMLIRILMRYSMSPTQFFKCLSDDTRLRCVTLLQKEGKLCVCELTTALALSQPKISRHLASLRQCGLLQDSREGQWVYYQINPELPNWISPLLINALAAVELTDSFKSDLERLQQMDNRPDALICC